MGSQTAEAKEKTEPTILYKPQPVYKTSPEIVKFN